MAKDAEMGDVGGHWCVKLLFLPCITQFAFEKMSGIYTAR
jgi:hypothetical protein